MGDYEELAPDFTLFHISRMRPIKYSWLVLFHEFIEWGICKLTGVKMKAIDKFDMEYEKARESGAKTPPCKCRWREEPGDDMHAPYSRRISALRFARRR